MEQEICRQIWNSGCYFLCLLKFCNEEDNAIKWYKKALSLGYMEKDCYINNPTAILKMITGKNFNVVKQSGAFAADLIITRYYNPISKKNHFVITDENAVVKYDPLGKSNTVKNGYPESYRLFTEIK